MTTACRPDRKRANISIQVYIGLHRVAWGYTGDVISIDGESNERGHGKWFIRSRARKAYCETRLQPVIVSIKGYRIKPGFNLSACLPRL